MVFICYNIFIKNKGGVCVVYRCFYNSPIGFVQIEGTEKGIMSIRIVDIPVNETEYITDEMKKCLVQLDEYFGGKRKSFDLNIIFEGTEFQKSVWKALMKIPYGKTVGYKDIAESIGNPRACRAVGNANNKNKLWIVVPCHRVINSDGSIGGYGGAVWRKEYLLKLEKDNS